MVSAYRDITEDEEDESPNAALARRAVARIRPGWGYYRRYSDGWIVAAESSQSTRVNLTEEGWEYLRAYGNFDMIDSYTTSHPHEQLFATGGAKELPYEQVIELGYHLNPPLMPNCRQGCNQNHKRHSANCWYGAKKVVFPQLRGRQVPPAYKCGTCSRADFTSLEGARQHESVAHREENRDVRTGSVLGASIAEALGKALGTTPPAGAMTPENVMAFLEQGGVKLSKAQRDYLTKQGAETPTEETEDTDDGDEA